LTPGKYIVFLRSSDRSAFESVTTEFEVRAGENEISLALSKASVNVNVVDADGGALSGATVNYRSLKGESRFNRVAGVSDSRGSLILRHLAPGLYRVNVHKIGYELKRIEPVNVEAGKESILRVTLQKEGKIIVRALDADGQSIAGASVRAVPQSFATLAFPFLNAEGDRVVVDRLAADEYVVTVRAPGYFPSLTRVKVPTAATVEHAPRLVPSGRVKVTVRSASGAALASAPVLIRAAGIEKTSDDWLLQGFTQSSTGTNLTNEKGEITFEGIPAALLTITVPGAPPSTVTAVKGELREAVVVVP
jgi:hypothetical protein